MAATGMPPHMSPAMRELGDLPFPPGLPLLGNLLQIEARRIHTQVEAWARRYGPLFTIRLGRTRLLVIADHVAMSAVLRDRPEGFRRTPRMAHVSREMGIVGGVFGAEGEAWKRQRRMVMAGFDPRHLRLYFPQLVGVSARLDRRWRKAAEAQLPIDLQADLMRFTVDAVSGLAFGAETHTLESDDDVIQRHLDKIFPALFRRLLAPLPTWRWWKTAADRELDRSVHVVNAAVDAFVAAARSRLAAEPARREAPANLLEAMLVAAADEGSGITDAEVSGNVLTMLLAGEDTTANTLAWLVWLLHRHPEALATARAEIDRVAGLIGEWTPERFAALEYVDACASETMRLKPVAPSLVLQALRDTAIGGVRVPAGTLVWGALRSDSLKDEFFDDAMEFRPQRWLAHGSSRPAASVNRVAMPFGAGPRVCPGRQLAMLEIKMALAVLLSGYDIEALTTAAGGEPEERLSFTMAPEPLTMRLSLRSRQ